MELSFMSGFWLFNSAALVVAYFVDQHPSVPRIWRSLFRWGKMRVGIVKGPKQIYEVPKRWFQHFYLIATAVNVTLLTLFCCKLFLDKEWPSPLSSLLEQLQYPVKFTEITDARPVLLVLMMEGVQVCRRCYETFFVNVFSKTATMTLFHYLLGIIFYFSIGLGVLAGTSFSNLHFPDSSSLTDWLFYALALLLFVSASLLQHRSFRILALLRSHNKNKTKQSAYPLPEGGLFDVISCPHFLAEIGVYLSFCVVFQFQHTILLSIFVFVLVNQVLASLLTYQWYCMNFTGYGKTRYAIFPYLL